MKSGKEPNSVGFKTAKSSMIVLLSHGGGMVLQVASIVLLSRLLLPADFGVFSMCMAIVGASLLFQSMGLSSATVQVDEISREQQSNLFWVNISMGGILTILLVLLAPTLGRLFHEPLLDEVLVKVSPVLIFTGISAQFSASLKRNIEVGKIALSDIISSIVGVTISLVFAFFGFGYWSLVYGLLSRSCVRMLLLVYLSTFKPMMPCRRSKMRHLIEFGKNITIYNTLEYLHRNVDNLLIGRFLGSSSLGLYSRAYSMITVVLRGCKNICFSVFFPILSRLQKNREEFRSYYLQMTWSISILAALCFAISFSMSEELILVVLGPGWEEVMPILRLFSFVLLVQIIDLSRNVVLLSLGEGKIYAIGGGVQTLLTALGIIFGLSWGIIGVAVGYTVASVISFLVLTVWSLRGTPIDFSLTLRAVRGPLCLGGGACITTLITSSFLIDSSDILCSLLLKLTVVLTTFVLVIMMTPRRRVDVLKLLKQFRTQKTIR